MKNSELIKKLQHFSSDMEIVLFDHRQNLFNADDEGTGIGIHTDFEVGELKVTTKDGKSKVVAGLAFINTDYKSDGSVDFGSALCAHIEK